MGSSAGRTHLTQLGTYDRSASAPVNVIADTDHRVPTFSDRTEDETYPMIFQRTCLDPSAWADTARTCAYANVLRPSPHLGAKAKAILLTLADFTFEFEHHDVGMNYGQK